MSTRTEVPPLVVSRLIHAPPERVFRAWSDPEVAARWGWGSAYDTIAVELDCRPGGHWRHEIRDRNTGETFWFDGVFREVVPGRRVVHTFKWTSDRGHDEPESLVAVELVPRGADTEVVITHTALPPDKVRETDEGWKDCLEQIDRAVAGPATPG